MNKYLYSKANCKLIFIFFISIHFRYSYAQQISTSVHIISGAVNGVVIKKNGKTLVIYGDPTEGIKKAEMVLFTHFRRDVIWAGKDLVQGGSLAIVPTAEKLFFTKPDSIWKEFTKTRFHDNNIQTTKIGILPFKVHRFIQDGEIVKWQDINIKAVATPGYTRGAVSYIADIDNKRFAFVGDLIYGDGKIFDLYSLQDSIEGIKGRQYGCYHGYAARIGSMIKSLQLIAEQKPDFIIPARGPVIKTAEAAIKKVIERLQLLYQNYLSISAYRWYFPERMDSMANEVLAPAATVDWMPLSSVLRNNPPSWLMHISNTYLVFSNDSSAFLIDCGDRAAFEKIIAFKKQGRLKSLDGIFITHYHDDHVDLVNELVKEFNCPVYITKELKDILENPAAFRMPVMTVNPIQNLIIAADGQQKKWKEFMLTFRYFPGQTIYHDAMLIEKEEKNESIFFVGDSFTPSGIDDYCLQNRNLLHDGMGYFYCFDILKNLPAATLLVNQHVAPLFAFSTQQLKRMKQSLLKRNDILKELLPWDDINYGIDEQWSKLYPYGQKIKAGETVKFSVKIFNHSKKQKLFVVKPNVPNGFSGDSAIISFSIAPGKEGERTFILTASPKLLPGVFLLTVNVKFDNVDLREWSEAIIEVLP